MKILDFRSYRRMILDSDLEDAKEYIKSIVLDVGGGRKRGNCKKPDNASWIVFDINKELSLDILTNAHDLPIKSDTIGCVKCSELLEHTEEPESVVKEYPRVLRSMGFLMSTTDAFIFYICPSVGEIND